MSTRATSFKASEFGLKKIVKPARGQKEHLNKQIWHYRKKVTQRNKEKMTMLSLAPNQVAFDKQ